MKKMLSTVLMLFPLLAGAADPAFEAGASFGKGNASRGTGGPEKSGYRHGGNNQAIPLTPPGERVLRGAGGWWVTWARHKGQAALQGQWTQRSRLSTPEKRTRRPPSTRNAPFITIVKNAEAWR